MHTELPTCSVASNGQQLPFSNELFAPMLDSTALLRDGPALRERLRTDGYLLLRGVLGRSDVEQLRRSYLARFPRDGTGLPEYGVAGHPAHEFVRSTDLEAFIEQPALRMLAEALLAGPVDRLPRTILRHFPERTWRSSRAHTDFDYMDRGSDELVTMWLPVGDCAVHGGALVYLEGSAGIDRERLAELRLVTDRAHDPRPLSHDLGWVARSLGRRWLWTDYRAGDLAVHTPHLVHAALDNASATARVSLDVRFIRRGAPVDARWTNPWSADDGA